MNESRFQNENTSGKYITTVSVDGIKEVTFKRKFRYMFVISVIWSDGKKIETLKEYKEFFDFQCSILDEFPVESGKHNKERVIPYLPGRKIFRRDDIHLANERKPLLDNYIKEIINLEPKISQSKLILDFFEQGKIDEDVEGEQCQDQTAQTDKTKTMKDCLSYVNTSYSPENNNECV